MKPPPIYTEDYTGQRWTYVPTYRPAQIGITVPEDGFIIDPERARQSQQGGPHMFGTIQYARELTQDEVDSYQLRKC